MDSTTFRGRKKRAVSSVRKMGFGLVVIALLSAAGCGKRAPEMPQGKAGSSSGLVLRIGYGKGGSLDIVRLQKTLEKRLAAQGIGLEWLNFPMGPQMMEAIGTGSLDLGSAASTPPIFAQAAGVPFVYAANIPPGKSGGAVLVPKDSPIRTVADLKGKRIAFQPGSVWQYDLVKLLEQAGLAYKDITPIKLPPADASAAFNSGSIDAWVQGEPYVTLAQRKSAARIVTTTDAIPSTGGFYLAAAATVKDHPEWIKTALEEIQKAGDWAKAHPHEAAVLTASDVGLDVPTIEQMIRNGTIAQVQPVDETTVRLQQEQADLLEHLGVLPKHIEVRQVILRPQEYAKILPAPSAESRQAASR